MKIYILKVSILSCFIMSAVIAMQGSTIVSLSEVQKDPHGKTVEILKYKNELLESENKEHGHRLARYKSIFTVIGGAFVSGDLLISPARRKSLREFFCMPTADIGKIVSVAEMESASDLAFRRAFTGHLLQMGGFTAALYFSYKIYKSKKHSRKKNDELLQSLFKN